MQNESIDTSGDIAEFMRSFEEYDDYDDDSVIIYDNTPKPKITNPATEMLNGVLLDRAKYNKSYDAACSHSKSINSVPGAQFQIPTEKNKMKKQANLKYSYEYHIFCDKCKSLVKNNAECPICASPVKKKKNNYFVYINIHQQILNTLDKHLGSILNHVSKQRESGQISDSFDGDVYKEVNSKLGEEILLPLSINVDGAKIFNSSKTTLWPIQVIQHYLPEKIRYLRENILIVGLYCGPEKPDVSVIMEPFAVEMNKLRRDGLFTWHEDRLLQFLPSVLYCVCDRPARAEMQNCKQSGYYGCMSCLQKGDSVKNPKTERSYVRFLKTEESALMRTHEQAISAGRDMMNGKELSNANGLKGLSCMIAFKDFDLAKGFVFEYMHAVCIGIVPLFLDIVLGKKKLVYQNDEPYRFKQLSVNQKTELNRRIVSLKPPMSISHKPKPILDHAFYTANEFRSLLFYYFRFSLYGILSKELITHFTLLSEAIYTLCKVQITKDDVMKAGLMLEQYADQFQLYYGKNSMNMNIHSLRHCAQSVLNTGPLWCQSTFPYESNIGELKRSFNCTVDVVEQIAFNYSIKAASDKTNVNHREQVPQILRLKRKQLTCEQKAILNAADSGKETDICYGIGYEMSWKNVKYKSTASPKTKSIDYFIQLFDGTIASIEYFINLEKPYAVVRRYDVVKSHGHLIQVKPSHERTHQLFTCDSIQQKLIYLKFDFSNVSFIEIVTSEPNPFECN